MNTSNIADMFRADPNLAKDVPGFLARMNAKTIERVTKTRVEIVEATILESLADTMGGEATERDVKDALVLLAAEPLLEAEKVRHEEEIAAIIAAEAAKVADPVEVVKK